MIRLKGHEIQDEYQLLRMVRDCAKLTPMGGGGLNSLIRELDYLFIEACR